MEALLPLRYEYAWGITLQLAVFAQVLHMGTAASHELCLDMATTQAAQALGINEYGINPGKVADLVILDAISVCCAIGAAPIGRTAIKNGRVVAQSKLEQQFFAN